jgi:hypothetical protein
MRPGNSKSRNWKKLLALIVFSLAMQSIQISSSQAANTPNGACPVLGKSTTIGGISYLCTKNGKKQLWSTAPSAQKMSTNDQKLEDIYNEVKVKLKGAESHVDLSLNIDPQLTKSLWSKDSVASIPTANKLLTVLNVRPVNQQKIYISWGTEYKNKFAPDYCRYSSGGGLCGQTGIIFADLKWFADNWGYGGVEAPYKWEMDDFSIKANLPHEIGHYGQEESAAEIGNTDYWKYDPGWLREGAAEYFKLLSSAYDRKVSYKKLHDMYLTNSGSKRCAKYSLLSMSAENSNSDGCEYSKGLFAAELLVIKTGRADGIYDMERTIGTDTASIFKKAYGFSLASFCAEVDAYFAQITANLK